MLFSAANAYERLQKNIKRVFSVNLFSIFLIYKLINSKEIILSSQTQSITIYTNFVHERNVLKNVFSSYISNKHMKYVFINNFIIQKKKN